ncbi:MAG: hypothetical protein A4S09_04375 [Proteobacteria bacterium SG_bin7]|nr:MAG: hypothetical protein A4S09_04375 [Proteobacteria bacterium SG_bin7]
MKRTFVVGLLLAIFIPGTAMAQKVVGTLAVVKGQVEIKDASGKSTPAKMGSKVKEKDTIIAGKEGRAKLIMIDQNVLNISPESQINLETYKFEPEKNDKNVVINVLYGKVRSTVNQKYDGDQNKFNVKTPAAVAGVRGTDFLGGYNAANKTSNFVTFKGLVQVGTPGPGGAILNAVMVAPGQQTTAIVGAPPAPPSSVPKADLANMNNESTADKNGKSDHREPANDSKGPINEEKKENKQEIKEEAKQEPKQEAKQEARQEQPATAKNDEPKKESAAPPAPKSEGGAAAAPVAKSDGASPAPKAEGAAAPAPATPNSAAPAPRMPSSVGGPAPSPGGAPAPAMNTGGVAPAMPTGSGMVMPPPPPMIEVGPVVMQPPPIPILPVINMPPPILDPGACQYCNETIANGPSKVKIIINTPTNP